MRWQEVADQKEKYQAYLCSREWSEKKEAVRKRCNGVCERCKVNAMNAVHHLTYERKYAERLDDLQAICNGCHDFTHAKSQHDPRVKAPVFIERGKPIRSVYLAGKITGDDWRGEIVDGWAYQNHSGHNYGRALGDSDGKSWDSVPYAAPAAFGAKLDYVGPWWFDCGVCGGHGTASDCWEPHAYTYGEFDKHGLPCRPLDEGERAEAMFLVRRNIDAAIKACDLLFAWINSDDCFGTIFEIGLAVARKKTVVVASPRDFDDQQMWLCQRFAADRVFADTAGEAWKALWEKVEAKK